MSNAAELYDRDFYAWTQDQAAALRAWPERLRPNTLDVEHLAEEIESLGNSDRRAVANLLRNIVIHLLKLRFHPDLLSHRQWRHEINQFRVQIEDVFDDSPSLRSQRAEIAEKMWARAARQLWRDLDVDGHAAAAEEVRRFAAAAPYFDLDREILNEEWFPDRT